MITLWNELSTLYNSQAVSRFGKVGDRLFIEWGDKLSTFTDKQLKTGLDNCLKAESNYAPSLKEFIGYCRNEVDGLTHNTAAYKRNPRLKALPHKCNPETARTAIEEMKKNVGLN